MIGDATSRDDVRQREMITDAATRRDMLMMRRAPDDAVLR